MRETVVEAVEAASVETRKGEAEQRTGVVVTSEGGGGGGGIMYSRRAEVARVMRSAESGVASAFRCMSTILATLMRLSRHGEC